MLRVAFIAGLSDKKLTQKLLPLQKIEYIERIDLFRRKSYLGDKINWIAVPSWINSSALLGDIWRLLCLTVLGFRYDVIIGCHQKFHGVMAWIIGIIWRKPVIQMIISSVDWAYEHNLFRRAVLDAQACGVRGKISLERLRVLGYTKPIEIIANPIDPVPVPAYSEIPPSYDLLAVGSYAEEKGYPWMLEVIARVRQTLPTIQVGIVGTGPYLSALGNLINQYQLESNIHFLGWKDERELARVYTQCRALILTSHTEGLPMVVIEAMAHARPVFVTMAGELPWLVRDGQEGKIVPYGDTEKMTVAITSSFQSPENLMKMGQAARARVEELFPEFQLESIISTWQRLLKSALG